MLSSKMNKKVKIYKKQKNSLDYLFFDCILKGVPYRCVLWCILQVLFISQTDDNNLNSIIYILDNLFLFYK